jgi:hypothetical protein
MCRPFQILRQQPRNQCIRAEDDHEAARARRFSLVGRQASGRLLSIRRDSTTRHAMHQFFSGLGDGVLQ